MSELGFTSPREMAAALFIIGGLIFLKIRSRKK